MAYPFELPELGYDYSALEPHVDARTMKIHHGKHHQGYTNKLNAALEDHSDFHSYSAEQLLRGLPALPEAIRTAVRNNGGGFHNHALFWDVMTPGGGDRPSGDVADAIADLSTLYTLAPGDLLFTGTPAGVGAVVPGDRVTGGIDGVGDIEITIVE